jgi:hypothetical protein
MHFIIYIITEFHMPIFTGSFVFLFNLNPDIYECDVVLLHFTRDKTFFNLLAYVISAPHVMRLQCRSNLKMLFVQHIVMNGCRKL